MFSYHRFKRNSGPLVDPIPVHPDANYRPEHRPTPPSASNARVAAPVLAAPLAAGTTGAGGFSPWWIIGPLLALLAALALGILVYAMKKKRNPTEDQKPNPDQPKTKTFEQTQQNPLKTVDPQRSLRSAAHPSPNDEKLPLKITASTKPEKLQKSFDPSPLQSTKKLKNVPNEQEKPSNDKTLTSNEKKTIDPDKLFLHQDPKRFDQSTGINKLFSPLHDKSQNDDLSKTAETSPIEHGVGKSPLLPTFPSGTKRKEKSTTTTSKSKSNLPLESTHDEVHSTSNPSNQIPKLSSSGATQSSNFDERKSDRPKSLMPNVPQCKGSTSSDENDEDFDELYSMTANNTSNPVTSKKEKSS